MNKRAVLVGLVLFTCAALAWGGKSEQISAAQRSGAPSFTQSITADAAYGKMPAYFIPNRGQMDKQVEFAIRGKDKSLYFTAEGITFEMMGRWVVKLDFVGAEKDIRPRAEEETGAVISYFKGRPETWRTGIPTYSKIVYPGLWPGIDLVCYGTPDRLKYEFVVRPGADPSRIRLAYRGVDKLAVDGDGCLTVSTPAGSFQDDAPTAYQESGGKRTSVALSYKVETANEEEPAYGFEVGGYDPCRPLILDPAILIYCGFIGGDYEDAGYGIAVDASGNAYLAGRTASSAATFPLLVGPDLTKADIDSDAFVAKVNPSGTALIYCGYIGGDSTDAGTGIDIDHAGNAYVTGYTHSYGTTFPVVVGPGLTRPGGYDAWVAKVNASGTALVYCGYIGGSSEDYGSAVKVDGAGSAYVVGYTGSSEATFPVLGGPDVMYNGAQDAFVAKVDPSGATLVYCGYIGGTDVDTGSDIALDAAGNAYITGSTSSIETTFPVAVGPDLTQNGRGTDAFVAKVNTAGTALIYCGYIGGAGDDKGGGIAVDKSGNACVSGGTASTEATFPVKIGPSLVYSGGTSDAFVAKVGATGADLVYCGYIGGSESDSDYWGPMAVDAWGNVYVAGYTSSTELTFPVGGGPDLSHNGAGDAYLAKVDETGSSLVFCGYIGGSRSDYASDLAVDASGNVYVVGGTESTQATFPVTAGPYLTKGDSGIYDDAFVARIYPAVDRVARHAVGDFDGDGADEAAFDFGTGGAWLWDGGPWTHVLVGDPKLMIAADLDGDNTDEIIGALGAAGLWAWKSGTWNQMSSFNAELIAAGDLTADGRDELVGDFGAAGVWLWNRGAWSQIAGSDAQSLTVADPGGAGAGIIASFGAAGLWAWSGGGWSQLSGGVSACQVTAMSSAGPAGANLAANFGPVGMWVWGGGSWLQISGLGPGCAAPADVDGDGADELFADFGPAGLWTWISGAWQQASGEHVKFMIAADVDGDGAQELAADFGRLGLWLWKAGAWSQLRSGSARNIMAGDVDGDGADELVADFLEEGIWIWNAGTWSQIGPLNPQ